MKNNKKKEIKSKNKFNISNLTNLTNIKNLISKSSILNLNYLNKIKQDYAKIIKKFIPNFKNFIKNFKYRDLLKLNPFAKEEKSEIGFRIIYALVIAFIGIAVLQFDFKLREFSFLVILILSALGLYEFFALMQNIKGFKPFKFIAGFFSLILILSFYSFYLRDMSLKGNIIPFYYNYIIKYFHPDFNFFSIWLIFFMIVLGFTQIIFRNVSGASINIALSFFGPFYTVFTISHLFLYFSFNNSLYYIYLFLIIPIFSDAGAYFVGKYLGKHKLKIEASPNKTIEGFIGAYIIGTSSALLYNYLTKKQFLNPTLNILTNTEIIVLSIVLITIIILADLFESVLKRDVKVKDSGSLIPGHGGVLDLMDAMYISIPLGYYYILLRLNLHLFV